MMIERILRMLGLRLRSNQKKKSGNPEIYALLDDMWEYAQTKEEPRMDIPADLYDEILGLEKSKDHQPSSGYMLAIMVRSEPLFAYKGCPCFRKDA